MCEALRGPAAPRVREVNAYLTGLRERLEQERLCGPAGAVGSLSPPSASEKVWFRPVGREVEGTQ